MDSFIEKKRAEIKRLQTAMYIKFSFSVLLLMSLPIWISSITVQPAPETWLSAETVCVEISVNDEEKNPYAMITGADGGSYLVDSRLLDPDEVAEKLQAGDECAFVYAPVGESSNKIVKAIEKDGESLLSREKSVSVWQNDRSTGFIAIAVTVAVAALSAILIDRIWCKNDRAEIKRLKAEIARREEKKSKRAGKQ